MDYRGKNPRQNLLVPSSRLAALSTGSDVPMLDHLLLWVNGRRHEVRGHDAFLSLSDFLRRRLGLTGTKIVCSEGDCGSCTVLVGRMDEDGRRLVYRPVDACIQYLFQLEGTHIVTVEGLGTENAPSAVQQAMIDHHGSQCGFCTPGFVVAMAGLLEDHEALDEPILRCGLTGNLCRCTGYTPIIEAGTDVDPQRHQRVELRYPSAAMLGEISARHGQSIEIRDYRNGEQHVAAAPPDLPTALEFLSANPEAMIVAGATDVGVRFNKTLSLPATILDLNRVTALQDIAMGSGEVIAGASASWTALGRVFEDLVPEFYRIIAVFGGPQIRHVGTIGGNIANASPIADSLPFLYVVDAIVEMQSASGTRQVPITEFYKGYKKVDLHPGELIVRVRIPLPGADDLLRLYKVSRRRDLDIASFTAAIRLRLDGDTVADAAIAFGGVGPTVIRARRTEEFLRGRALDEDTMQRAGNIALSEVAPISDVRGAADYRYQLTRNILLKFYHETQAVAAPV